MTAPVTRPRLPRRPAALRGARARRHGLLVTALLAVVALCSGCGFSGLYGVTLPGGADVGSHPYTMTVYFSDVLDLVPQSSVKVNDVAVGRVQSVELSQPTDASGSRSTNGWTAKVTILVNGDVSLPQNARAEIKQTTLLGEKYVALEQPLAAPVTARLGNGSSIPITRTSSAPEVEQVLGALSLLLNGGGLQQIHIITTELNKALDGNEGAIRDLLAQLNTFVGTLDQQKNQILTALAQVNTLAATLRQNTATIDRALGTLPQALTVLKQNRSKLTTLLVSLSHLGATATRVITASQTHFVSTLKALSPTLEQLTAAGSSLTEGLKIAGTFPFPLGQSNLAVHGDYANLNAVLDLNLSNQLCGLSRALCTIVKGPQPASASTTPLAGPASSPVQAPTLLGTGG